MNNNRLTIISPSDKRRKAKYNFIMFVLLIVILGISFAIGYGYFTNKEASKNNNQESTTTTTTTQVVTTEPTTEVTTNQVQTNNYIYSFMLSGNDYKIYVCNGDYVSRITNIKLYNKNDLLGDIKDTNGLLIDKSKIDLTNKPTLMVEVHDKKYIVKYDGRC